MGISPRVFEEAKLQSAHRISVLEKENAAYILRAKNLEKSLEEQSSKFEKLVRWCSEEEKRRIKAETTVLAQEEELEGLKTKAEKAEEILKKNQIKISELELLSEKNNAKIKDLSENLQKKTKEVTENEEIIQNLTQEKNKLMGEYQYSRGEIARASAENSAILNRFEEFRVHAEKLHLESVENQENLTQECAGLSGIIDQLRRKLHNQSQRFGVASNELITKLRETEVVASDRLRQLHHAKQQVYTKRMGKR